MNLEEVSMLSRRIHISLPNRLKYIMAHPRDMFMIRRNGINHFQLSQPEIQESLQVNIIVIRLNYM